MGFTYPIMLDLQGKRCVVIGGGAVAERRVGPLLEAGAEVTLISPAARERIAGWDDRGQLRWLRRSYRDGDLSGAFLAVLAAGDPAANEAAQAEARRTGVLLNHAEQAELGDFAVPAVVRRGRLVLSVSTSGASPTFAASIKGDLERRYGDEYEICLDFLHDFRELLHRLVAQSEQRQQIQRAVSKLDLLKLIREGRFAAFKDKLLRTFQENPTLNTIAAAAGEAEGVRTIIVGTRQSALALTQTGQVIEQLEKLCLEHGIPIAFEIRKIVTRGDRILDVTLSKVGGKGLFVKEIEQALLDGEIDMAVHSMKDMPWELPDGLVLGCVPTRVDPRDCLVSRDGAGLAALPAGAKVGTSSLRRSSQLRHARPDLAIEPIRGNIDSRLRKLETEGFAAIVLAAAGLARIGWKDRASEFLPPEVCLPAVGQGALGIECRGDDKELLELLSLYNDRSTALAVAAERSFLGRLNGGCQVPIGAHAVQVGSAAHSPAAPEAADGAAAPGAVQEAAASGTPQPLYRLTGMVGTPDGTRILKETGEGTDPVELGIRVAEALIAQGADQILAEFRGEIID